MDIQLNLATPQADNITLDEVIFSQATTELTFSVTPSDKTLIDGLSCALLTPQGKTLAHALTNSNKAVLDTSTIECYEYVQGLPIEGAKDAYIVIGESTKPLAIVSVQVAKNYLADIAPPSATAPVYPTSQELQAILARLTEIETNVNTDKDVVTSLVEGFDETVQEGVNQVNTATTDGVGSINALVDGFDTQVTEAVSQVTNATQSGTEAINATTQQGATYLDSITNQGTTTITNATNTATTTIANATNQATTTIDNKVDAFNTILEQDRQEIADAVIEAEGARDDAVASASNASTSATQATEAKDTTVAIKDELQGALDVVDNAESVMLKKANVIDFMPIRNYIYTYFGKDEYLTFAGLTQLDNGDFIVASAKYRGGVDGKLLVFFQFNQQLELVHKVEITLTDGVYGNFYGHFVVVDGVLNHIIRGIRREFILDVEDKISLGNTYTIDASALGVNPWDSSNVQELGETQAFVLGNYIVYEKFVLNKNTNIVESLLASRITSVTEPVATSTSFVWFVANRKTAYKATIDSEGAISFTQGGTYAIPGYPTESVRIAHTNNGTDTVLLSALCGTPNFGTGDIKVYSLLWGFAYGTGVGVFSPNIFTDDRVISQRLFTSSKDNLFFFDSTNKMFHLLLGRSTHYRISDYMLDAHLQFKIEQSKAKIISSNSKGVLFVASTKTTGQILSPQIFRGFQEITHAYYIPWEQE